MDKRDRFEKIWDTWIRMHWPDCNDCKRLMQEGQVCDVAWAKFEALFEEHVVNG